MKRRVLVLAVFLACLLVFFAMAFFAESKGLSSGQVVSNLPKLIWNAVADMLSFFTSNLGLLILFVAVTAIVLAKQR